MSISQSKYEVVSAISKHVYLSCMFYKRALQNILVIRDGASTKKSSIESSRVMKVELESSPSIKATRSSR